MRNTAHNLEVFFVPDEGGRLLPLVSGRAITEVFFFGGRRGSGKTYAAGVLVEQLLYCGLPVIIVDVVGTWWGLRVGANGDPSKGFKIPVIGGDHGDIGIVAEGGAAVAQMLVDTGSSAVLDLSSLRKGARQRFLTDWAEEFFHGKKSERSPVHVVLEEAHTIIPQRVMKGQERMLGALEDLVRLGRNYGIGVSMLDQRPQSVHKDVLNQAEVLCAFQLTGAQERDAIRRWAEAKELAGVKDAFTGLSSLPRGECILWSPEWLKFCGRVEVAGKSTFDASATPDASTNYASKKMRPIDLPALEAAMQKAAGASKSRGGGKSGIDSPDRANAVSGDHARSGASLATGNVAESQGATDGSSAASTPTLDLQTQIAVLEKEVAAIRETEKTLRHELAVARDDLRVVRDKWARALSAVGVIRGAVDDLGPILQIGELQTLGSTEVVNAPGHPANGARAVHKDWAGSRELGTTDLKEAGQLASDQTYKTWVPTASDGHIIGQPLADRLKLPVEPTMKAWSRGRVIPVKQNDNPDYKVEVFMPPANGGAGEGVKMTDQMRTFLTVLAQRGPQTQTDILMYAGVQRSGGTDRTFAALKQNGWVIVGNFGNGSGGDSKLPAQLSLTGLGKEALGAWEALSRPELADQARSFLVLLAQQGRLSQRQILLYCGIQRSGGTDRTFAELKKRGYARVVDDLLEITDFGREVLGPCDPVLVGMPLAHALVSGAAGTLSPMEREFLLAIWNRGSDGITNKAVLAERNRVRSGATDRAFKRLIAVGYAKRSGDVLVCPPELYDHD